LANVSFEVEEKWNLPRWTTLEGFRQLSECGTKFYKFGYIQALTFHYVKMVICNSGHQISKTKNLFLAPIQYQTFSSNYATSSPLKYKKLKKEFKQVQKE
jgi:hypothetical protein